MRSRLALLTAIAALAVSLFALPGTDAAGPPTIAVDDDGLATPQSCNANVATHQTIAAGVNAAAANWVVKVCPGSYAMGAIPLLSTKGGLVVQGPRPQDARNRRLPDAREAIITSGTFVFEGVGQKVEGFAFTGPIPIVDSAGANAVRIQHNLFSGYAGTAITLDGIGSGGNLIEKNRFIGLSNGSSGDAIRAIDAGRLSVNNNTFINIGEDAVDLAGVTNTTVQNNQATNVGQFALVDSSSSVIVRANTVTQTSAPGVPALLVGPAVEIVNTSGAVNGVTVDRNRMSYTVSDGITVSDNDGGAISNVVIGWNRIDYAAGDGVSVLADDAGAVALRSNVVVGVVNNGINVDAVANGIILDRNRAIGSWGFDCYDGDDPTDNTWTYNSGRTDSPATICR